MTLVARGFDEAIKDRSAAAQMLGRPQRVEDITGLSGEIRGLDRNPKAPLGSRAVGSRRNGAHA